MKIVGILLIVLGVLALAYQGIRYTTREKLIDIGPLNVTTTEKKNIPSQSDWVTGLRFAPDSKSFAVSRFDGSYQSYKL